MSQNPQPIQDPRLRPFSTACYQLIHAAIDNDWGAMQRAIKMITAVIPDAAQQPTELRTLLNRMMPDQHYQLLTKHCVNCHEVEDKHVGGKCLFSAQEFLPCNVYLNEATIGYIKRGLKIDSIKEYRAASGRDLRSAKETVESEARRHGWQPW